MKSNHPEYDKRYKVTFVFFASLFLIVGLGIVGLFVDGEYDKVKDFNPIQAIILVSWVTVLLVCAESASRSWMRDATPYGPTPSKTAERSIKVTTHDQLHDLIKEIQKEGMHPKMKLPEEEYTIDPDQLPNFDGCTAGQPLSPDKLSVLDSVDDLDEMFRGLANAIYTSDGADFYFNFDSAKSTFGHPLETVKTGIVEREYYWKGFTVFKNTNGFTCSYRPAEGHEVLEVKDRQIYREYC
jgi:hypothetical protein